MGPMRKFLAIVAIATTSLVGTAGIAAADTGTAPKAKVDCPPLPLPEKNRPDRPTGSPEPSPLPSPVASPEPSASAGLLPSASPSPSASPEPPVDPLCIRVVSAITGHLAGLIDALIALLPPPSVPPSGTP